MHLLDLPNDVLRLVLEESLVNIHNEFEASKTNMMKTLKANLPRLAVCRQLRCLALPIVHSAVFIQHGDMASWRIGPWGHYSHSTDDRPEDVKMTTNLDFAVAAGCVHAVKQVGIYVYCIENPFPGLGAVARLMRTAAERWGGLKVYCTRDTCLLFERAMFPTHMDSITCEIEGSNALAAISSILEDARGSEEIVLNFHHHCLSPALPGLFTCTSVTDLQIWSGDSVSAILDLVRGLPNLTSLTLTDVESNANFDDVSVPEPGDTCLVEPFDTKLRKVCIYAYCDEQEQVLLIPTVKCLLLRTPTLAVFASGMVPEGPIMDFVDAYSAQYPHLATIAFMFRGDKWGFFGGADLW
ncbi:hypothetical protein H4R18_001662 [Coemansia javaensis]|uniref:F-box domain-containing protein n=1 Tax=Coemansia javaensis TaxID=2761396 RepID=A0A9W8HKU9_9FUNG|nr:hypothetical protein H4R18_001662 [Coemansia javaensis]